MSALNELRLIEVASISTDGRLRPVDEVAAQAIAASIARDGLLNPIDVCQLPGKSGFQLVFGGHRVAAAKLLGWEMIPAFVRSNNALERKSREIAENLFKSDLSPLDRTAFISELIEVEKARLGICPEKDGNALNKRGGKGEKKQISDDLCIVHKSLGLQEGVAIKLGLTQSTVSRTLALNGLIPSGLDRIRKLPVADNAAALRKLAAMPWVKQLDVIAKMEAGNGFAQAVAIVEQRVVAPPETRRLSTFLDTFGRMGRKERIEALRELAKMAPPSVSIVFQEPAVPVRKSISSDYVVCLEDGLKFKDMRRHLRTKYGMTAAEYRDKWNLPKDYPLVAPAYQRERDELARKLGLTTAEERRTALTAFHAAQEAAE